MCMLIAAPSNNKTEALITSSATGYLSFMGYNNLLNGSRPIICLNSNTKLEKQQNDTYLIVE